MNFGKSKNPMFSEKAIAKAKALELDRTTFGGGDGEAAEYMTVSGAVNKTFLLTGLLILTALFSYTMPQSIYMPLGALGAAGVFMLTSFKPHLAPTTAPVFAILEGLFVGTVSWMYAATYEGIIFQAVSATMAVLFTMLMIHKSGLIPVTQKFRMGVSMAVG
ncbi:MAG: putative YccA/Bax inhibitor family protein, partial [Saprospiraceae bacterium]